MNGFVENSIESGAASAGWSFFCKCGTNLSKILLTVVVECGRKIFFQDVERTNLKRMRHEMRVVVGRFLARFFSCN